MRTAKRALRAAFPHTIPVLTGYLFLGMAFGILLRSKGFGAAWAFCMSLFIFAGSMQFVAVGLLVGGFAPVQALLLTLMVNARHIFYGVAMLEDFRSLRREKPYMIFALTDETFSLLCSVSPPADIPSNAFRLSIAALNHMYWVAGSVLGALAGSALSLTIQGVEFVMTALFVVIFLQQWQTRKGRAPALMGLGATAACLVLFGAERFIPPAMAAFVGLLLLMRGPLEGRDTP